jgi:carboxymethylenebutenolidase
MTDPGNDHAATRPVVDVDVEVTTPDGVCDAAFIHPAAGSHPGVLIWSDAFGLRPVMRDMGRRLAADGYSVLVPNPFYRAAKPPVFDMATFSFKNEADVAALRRLIADLNAPGAVARDAVALLAFLDAQPQVDTSKKIGVQGYCMGGPLALRTAAAVPNRVGAAASFHGGGLVTDKADSPHLLVSAMKARLYIGIASNDDERQPDAKNILRDACAAANVPAGIEVYRSLHGWCMPDMPAEAGRPIYSEPDAERAWSRLLALYKATLA